MPGVDSLATSLDRPAANENNDENEDAVVNTPEVLANFNESSTNGWHLTNCEYIDNLKACLYFWKHFFQSCLGILIENFIDNSTLPDFLLSV